MSQERRVINNPNIRISNEGERGFIEGLGSTKGYLDDYGTIWIDGSYVGLDKFLRSGYMPDTHGAASGFVPTMENNVAQPIAAVETEDGLFIKGEFHSKQRAQDVRTDALERLEKGQYVGFSIGFDKIKSFRIYPNEYEKQLPIYLKPKYLKEGLERAKSLKFVEILQETQINEVSILLCQSHEDAVATNVRMTNKPEVRAKHLGIFLEQSIGIGATCRVMDALTWNVLYDVFYDAEDDPIAARQKLVEAWAEGGDIIFQIFDFIQTLDVQEDMDVSPTRLVAQSLREHFSDPTDLSPRSGQKVKTQIENLLIDLKDAKTRVEAIAKLREEARMGKVVSTTNHNMLTGVLQGIRDLQTYGDDLETFLNNNDPNAEETARQKSIALRAKVLRRKYSTL